MLPAMRADDGTVIRFGISVAAFVFAALHVDIRLTKRTGKCAPRKDTASTSFNILECLDHRGRGLRGFTALHELDEFCRRDDISAQWRGATTPRLARAADPYRDINT